MFWCRRSHSQQSRRWSSTAGPAGCRWARSSLRWGWRSGPGGPRSSPWTTWRELGNREGEKLITHVSTCLERWWCRWGLLWLISPALFILPPVWDSTNRPLKRAFVRKFTTRRPCSLMRMLVGYKAPEKKHTHTHKNPPDSTRAVLIYYSCSFLSSLPGTYPGARPAGGCQCHPSREWRCRTRRWGAAPTAGQSAASRRFPRGSGTRRTHKEARAGSRRTGPG